MRAFDGRRNQLRERRGTTQITTDGSGNATFSHGLGAIPVGVLLTLQTGGTGYFVAHYPPNTTSSVVAVVVYVASATRAASVTVTVNWLAWV